MFLCITRRSLAKNKCTAYSFGCFAFEGKKTVVFVCLLFFFVFLIRFFLFPIFFPSLSSLFLLSRFFSSFLALSFNKNCYVQSTNYVIYFYFFFLERFFVIWVFSFSLFFLSN